MDTRSAPMAPLSRENRPSIVGPEVPEKPYPISLKGIVSPGFGRGARFLGIPTANLPDSSLHPLEVLNHKTGIYYGFARIFPSTSTPLPTAPTTPTTSRLGTPDISSPHPSSNLKPTFHDSSPNSKTTSHDSPSNTKTKTNHDLHPNKNKKQIEVHGLSSEEIQNLPAETAPYPPDSEEAKEGRKRLIEDDTKVWPMVMSIGWNPYFKNEKVTAEVHIMHAFAHDFYGHDMSVLILGYIRPELDYVSKEALIADIQTDVKVALNSLAREGYAVYAKDPFFATP
ncbi:riboflavin kinase [Tremella mesenterica]|uniref:Riboflavin kinase n=1 Tax=Tremella mesenterica TaxID=5217 RepID=A0A4Q1BWH5_TREME|nr:riboflavin kinase [Tremella mesenterica]